MKASEKFKICPSCEGRAPLEVVICPYCASSFQENASKPKSPFASSYSPPYAAERVTPSQSEKVTDSLEAVKTEVEIQEKSVFLPIALLTIGSNLFILSVLLLILGHDGKVELEWSSHYWMLYGLLSAPLMFFGYKILKKEK